MGNFKYLQASVRPRFSGARFVLGGVREIGGNKILVEDKWTPG